MPDKRPPSEIDLTGEQSREAEAAEEGITQRVGALDDEPAPTPLEDDEVDADVTGDADEDDDEAVDPELTDPA